MESLSDTKWDVVISGTGLQQSLLALALSRSGKNVLHVDPNECYGGHEAALSLQEADEWARKHQSPDAEGPFAAAQATKEGEALSISRAYILALAPQLIHARSELLSLLVSSKAFRQIEFLAVGSFSIYKPGSESTPAPSLSRIPSTREDVFANTAIPARAKRSLMKFLKFVLEYDSAPHTELWKHRAGEPLASFLESDFKLDPDLRSYVVTLTLSLEEKISVEAGLAAINRHLTSMGVFGSGFAAVYPKWGGLSEVAQVGCRAGAVGGAVYMLGIGISDIQNADDQGELLVTLASGVTIRSKALVQASSKPATESRTVSRLTAVIGSNLSAMFEPAVQGAPTPCVAVVAFPAGSITTSDGVRSEFSTFALVHSSDTGECPAGQCTIYLSTISSPRSKDLLDVALSLLPAAILPDQEPPKQLYRLHYEQRGGAPSFTVDDKIGTFGLPAFGLAFDDSVLTPVREAWNMVMARDVAGDDEYMKFQDREGAAEEDDAFDA